MYKPTTALFKIAELSRLIRCIAGGQGAGKTIAILMLFINYCQHNKNQECTIFQAELSKMKRTVIRDFIKLMKSLGFFDSLRWNKSESIYYFQNGSYIEFVGLDVADIGKGFRRDLVYFNEANKGRITFDAFVQVQSRAKLTYLDFNPDSHFWAHDELLNDIKTDFITLTFKDNEYLPKTEADAILDYKRKGFHNPDLEDLDELFAESNIKSPFWANKWRVYGLGLVGKLEGIVLSDWTLIDSIPQEARLLGYGLDFGYSNDPSTLIAAYKYNKHIIFHECIYGKGLHNNELASLIKQHPRAKIYADSADPKSISELKRYGINIVGAKKGADSIMYGIGILQEQDILITKSSTHLIEELNRYKYAKDKDGNTTNKPVDAFNHCIDPMRYFASSELDNKKKFITARA